MGISHFFGHYEIGLLKNGLDRCLGAGIIISVRKEAITTASENAAGPEARKALMMATAMNLRRAHT